MRRLAEREAALALELAELCEADSRLGFHSEALCHRYYPGLLRRRAAQIRAAVLPEIDALAAKMSVGQTPWQRFFQLADAPPVAAAGDWRPADGGGYSWRFLIEGDDFVLEVAPAAAASSEAARALSVYVIDTMGVTFPVTLNLSWDKGGMALQNDNFQHVLGHGAPLGPAGGYAVRADGAAVLRWPLATLPVADRRLRLNLRLNASYANGNGYEPRLYLGGFSPEQAVLLQW
jgi:hypothetical protein